MPLAWSLGVASGQAPGSAYSPAYREGSAWDGLERIDPGSADLGPLGLQTRVLPTPLRDDRDFGLLYRAFTPGGDPVFARRDGGITAIFPRSAYVGTPSGEIPLIPPDTRFIIGEPASAFSRGIGLLGASFSSFADPSQGLRIDARIDCRVPETQDSGRLGGRADRREAERSPRRGVGALLRHAAQNQRREAVADR